EWVHVQLHQQKGMISLSPPTICNSALEKVENQNHAKWEVHNFTMGYQRQVTEDTYEYLLLNGEESFNDLGEPEWLFSRALGVDIPLTSLHIIG
ncbi:UNVERIFIED_CONTAM: YjfK family protein, partial [Escherichia coli]|uniref:DUF2491 family protein n=1 Tax=Escherichia coli TaxID=562 RepID=UPI002865E7D6